MAKKKENAYADVNFTVQGIPSANMFAADCAVQGADEKKDRHINVLVTAETFKALDKIRTMNHTTYRSMNIMINTMLAQFIEEHREDIDRYDRAFGEQ